MNIKILEPLFLHELGQRSNNEDFIMPVGGAATVSTRVFVVCDGVGGAEKGEVASRIVSQVLHNFLLDHEDHQGSEALFDEALLLAEAKLAEHLKHNPECKGMSTTATVLWIKEDGVHLAWAGDSRVYHFRRGQRLYRTADHSLVQEMVDRGQMTEDEAQFHPSSNVIMRAISGPENATKLDYHFIDDLEPGDFFLLCTDGIVEKMTAEDLTRLTGVGDGEMIRDHLATYCAKHSQDNHSMYLVEIDSTEDVIEERTDLQPDTKAKRPSLSKAWSFALLGLLAFFLIGTYMAWTSASEETALLEKQQEMLGKGDLAKDAGRNGEALQYYLAAQKLNSEETDLELKILEVQRKIEREGLENDLTKKLEERLMQIDAQKDQLLDENGKSLSDSIIIEEQTELRRLIAQSRFYVGLGDSSNAAQQIKGKESLPYSQGILEKDSYLLLANYYDELVSVDSAYLSNKVICLEKAGEINGAQADSLRALIPSYAQDQVKETNE